MKRWIAASLWFFALLGAGSIVYTVAWPKRVVEFPITLGGDNLAKLVIAIEGKDYQVGLAVTNKYPLALSDKTLDGLSKRQVGLGCCMGFDGEECEFPLFSLPSVLLGSEMLSDLVTFPYGEWDSDDEVGVLGWPLHRMGLFLDLPHRKVLGVRNAQGLKKLGYDLSKMVRAPYEVVKGGLRFQVMTEYGPRYAVVEPAGTHNFWNSSCDSLPVDQIELCVEGRSLGRIPVTCSPFPGELAYSLILGTGFLEKHTVYIAPEEQAIYIGGRSPNGIGKKAVVEVPIEQDGMGRPVVQVKVDRQLWPLLLDTGFDGDIHWKSETVRIEGYPFLFEQTMVNLAGELGEVPHYLIHECRIGKAKIQNVRVGLAKSLGVGLGVTLWAPTEAVQPVGSLGMGLLERSNVYLDMPRKKLLLVHTLEDLEELIGGRDAFYPIPFELENLGIILEVDSGAGPRRFLLDSGSGISFACSNALQHLSRNEDELGNAFWQPEQFVVGGISFGCKRLYSYEISPLLGQYDGVLGADFLHGHSMFIDYENQILYIKK